MAEGPSGRAAAGRVLIVDDEATIRELCRINFEMQGFAVEEACDGSTVVDDVLRFRPDVVFLDLMMPRVDGWGALARLRDNPQTAPVPVILLTASSADEHLLRGKAAGARGFVTKPFHPDDLIAAALEALRG